MAASQEPLIGKLGPLPTNNGTLYAEDRQRIFDATECSVVVRGRPPRLERALFVSGPLHNLQKAHDMARAALDRNGKAAKREIGDGSFQGTQERAEASRKRREAYEVPATPRAGAPRTAGGEQDAQLSPETRPVRPGVQQWYPCPTWTWHSMPSWGAGGYPCVPPFPAHGGGAAAGGARAQQPPASWQGANPSPGPELPPRRARAERSPTSDTSSSTAKRSSAAKSSGTMNSSTSGTPAPLAFPRGLRGFTFEIITVGCLQEPWHTLAWEKNGLKEALESHNQYTCDEIVLLDCRAMQGARNGVGPHAGFSTRVIKNIVEIDEAPLRRVFRNLAWEMQNCPRPRHLVFYCDHGKHRSTGVATICMHILRGLTKEWRVLDRHDLCRGMWSRKKCGAATSAFCAECENWNDVKEEACKKAAEWFEEEWREADKWEV